MPSLSLLGFTSLFYATFLPLLLLLVVGVLFVPCLLHARNAPAMEIGRALIAYLFMSIGAALILSGGIPWAFAFLSFQPTPQDTLVTFLILICSGVLTLLAVRRARKNIKEEAQVLPRAIFVTSFLLAGLLLILLGLLLLLLSGLTPGETSLPWSWWIAPVLLIVVGFILALLFSQGTRNNGVSILKRLKLQK
jgi:hypothetical protein